MKSFKGTQGNWFACCTQKDAKSHFVFGGEGHGTICTMNSNDPNDSTEKFESMEDTLTLEQRQSNAKLIAASPELLKSVQFFLTTFEPEQDYMKEEFDKAKELIEKILI